jgi:hypothetical protein
MFEEAWLSPEDKMALDNIERYDSYSDLDDYEKRLREELLSERWDREEDEEDLDLEEAEDDELLEFDDFDDFDEVDDDDDGEDW